VTRSRTPVALLIPAPSPSGAALDSRRRRTGPRPHVALDELLAACGGAWTRQAARREAWEHVDETGRYQARPPQTCLRSTLRKPSTRPDVAGRTESEGATVNMSTAPTTSTTVLFQEQVVLRGEQLDSPQDGTRSTPEPMPLDRPTAPVHPSRSPRASDSPPHAGQTNGGAGRKRGQRINVWELIYCDCRLLREGARS
jgi:hypothetical protein